MGGWRGSVVPQWITYRAPARALPRQFSAEPRHGLHLRGLYPALTVRLPIFSVARVARRCARTLGGRTGRVPVGTTAPWVPSIRHCDELCCAAAYSDVQPPDATGRQYPAGRRDAAASRCVWQAARSSNSRQGPTNGLLPWQFRRPITSL